MTPDEVVTRARELEGQEVLLTVRGVVHTNDVGVWLATQVAPRWIAEVHVGGALPDLVDIQPAPMRIERDTLYVDEDGRGWRSHGVADDGTWNLWPVCRPGGHRPADTIPGLKPGKVVPE